MAHHVLVAFTFSLLAVSVALRDSNKEKGTSSAIGIGSAGYLWRVLGLDADAPPNGSKDSSTQKDTSNSSVSQANPAVADKDQDVAASVRDAAANVVGRWALRRAVAEEPDAPTDAADAVNYSSKGAGVANQTKDEGNQSKDTEANNTSQDDWDYEEIAWDYNPFRQYTKGNDQDEAPDLKCPSPTDFKDVVTHLPRPFRHMCLLRYIMLYVCDLPNTTCTSCKCEYNPTEDPGHRSKCPLADCFSKIPGLWIEAYITPTICIIVAHMVLAPAFYFVLRYAMMVPLIQRFIILYIGTSEKAPGRPHFRIYLLVIQIFASMASVIFFCIMDMGEPSVFPWQSRGIFKLSWVGWVHFFMNIQMLVNYYVAWFKLGFRWDGVLSPNLLIDVATVHRTLYRQWSYVPVNPTFVLPGWNPRADFLFYARPKMNLNFLRAYRCLTALLEIQDMGAMSRFGAVSKQLIKSSLRLFALVILVSGFTTLLEWLGHDFGMASEAAGNVGECKNQGALKNNIACVPFLVGIYWVFTTISTVGYGDFTPHSAVSYVLVIVIIVGGVTFFSLESSTLIEVMSLQNNGLAPCIVQRDHVVVSGGAMRDVDEYVLNHFLHQLLHKAVIEQGGHWPFCCMLGNAESANQVIKFLETNLSQDMQRNLQFCNADPLTPQGLALSKISTASIVYILPSSTAPDMAREDEYNIHVALSVKAASKAGKTAPVPFRLVLFKPSSLKLAITNGIHPGQCLCLDQLRTAIMAQASEVRGWPCLLMGLTNNAIYDPSKFDGFCKQSLFPEYYGESCENCLVGFALSKTVGGKPFHVLANIIYQATGALLICAQIDGKVRQFPWNAVIAPDTVVFAIHNKDIQHGYDSGKFCSPIDWRPLFTRRRAATFSPGSWKDEIAEALDQYIKAPPATLSQQGLAEEDLEAHRQKAAAIKNGTNDFILVIMTAVDSYWQLLTMYIEKLPITGRSKDCVGGFSCIVFVDQAPPKNIVEHLKGNNPSLNLAFFVGNWMEPESIREAGAEQAKVIVTFEVNSLMATPDNDTRTFFLLRLIARMQLRAECCVLTELTSGMSGAHMIPLPRAMSQQGELLPRQPKELEEDCFNTSCAAGQVFVPRALLGVVAKSYYVFGIVEAIQNMTFITEKHECRPVQIRLPDELNGKSYVEIVEALLLARVGPHPSACIGVLRETLYSEAVMLHPPKHFRITKADLLIILATEHWVDWAQQSGLRLLGGRKERTANGS